VKTFVFVFVWFSSLSFRGFDFSIQSETLLTKNFNPLSVSKDQDRFGAFGLVEKRAT